MKNKFYTEKLRNHIKSRKLKNSYERFEVLSAIQALNKHDGKGLRFSANDIFDFVRQKRSNFSLSTIYRALPLMVEAGIVKDLGVSDGKQLYVLMPEGGGRCHLQCSKCGKAVEFFDQAFESMINAICKENGFEGTCEYFCISGVCEDCKKNFLPTKLGNPK